MSPRRFDSFLIGNDVAHEPPCPRLTVAERWCWIAGVKAIASKSPIRGALLIAYGEPASAVDVARQAHVTPAVARTTLGKLVKWQMLEHDDELGGLFIVDWHSEQREPKPSDSREAWRERKARQRDKADDVPRDIHADVTPNGHAESFAPASVKGREGKV